MNLEFYIDLGIIFVVISVDEKYYTLALDQVSCSRYGQALEKNKPSDVIADYFFKWELELKENGWYVTVNNEEQYYISNLNLLGVHFQNHSDEISDCFESVLFEKIVGYHASMVANQRGEAVMICGKVGSGKTTLTKAFIDNAYNYVSDDLSLVNKDLMCFYFRTSFHIRVTPQAEAHIINNEYRLFEKVIHQPKVPVELQLKKVIILNHLVDDNKLIKNISDVFQKFYTINSFLIGFPNNEYVFTLSKTMLSLPFFSINLSRNENPKKAARDIGDLIWQKDM